MSGSGAYDADCVGGGNAYIGHGEDVVLLCFTQEVGWWRNSIGLIPDEARRLAAALTEHADRATVGAPSEVAP